MPDYPYDPNQLTPAYDYNGNSSYSDNNNYIMNSGQNAIRDAALTAQNNFHNQMGTVLQGTMAAGMALYNTGRSVTSKAQEHIYNDMLLNSSGSYVLQRSAVREALWGFGIAGSELGRALQVGGRRPEFMTSQEYGFQMQRAVQHGRSELIDMAIAGGTSLGASAVSGALTGSTAMGMLGIGTGFSLAGLAAPIGIGLLVQQATKPLVQPMLDRRAAVREMAEFTEMADLNRGTGQRRMSEEASRELALRFHETDTSAWRYVPVVGGMIAGRLENKDKQAEIFKKMASMDLFRDINPEDIDKIQDRVKKTSDIMDKFAGMMNTTRETILKIKGQFNRMGFGDLQQNAALETVANFTYSTGFSTESALQLHGAFGQLGFQTGNFRMGRENLQGSYGLNEVASLKALQEGGLLSKMYDPGTLGQQFYMNATRTMRTGWGRVTEHGRGNVAATADYYRAQGGGNEVLGMEMENIGLFGRTGNVLGLYEGNVDQTIDRLMQGGMTRAQAVAYIQSRETTPEGKEQAWLAVSGLRQVGLQQSVAAARITALNRIEPGSTARGAISLNATAAYLTRGQLFSGMAGTDAARISRMEADRDQMRLSQTIEKTGDRDLYYKTKDFEDKFESQIYNAYLDVTSGLKESEKTKNKLYEEMTKSGYLQRNEEGKIDTATGSRMLNQAMRNLEKKENRFQKEIERVSRNAQTPEYAFMMDYNKRRGKLGLYNEEQNVAYRSATERFSSNSELLNNVVKAITASGGTLTSSDAEKLGLVPAERDPRTGQIVESERHAKAVGYTEIAARNLMLVQKGLTPEDIGAKAELSKFFGTMRNTEPELFKRLKVRSDSDFEGTLKNMFANVGAIRRGKFDWANQRESLSNQFSAIFGEAAGSKIAGNLEWMNQDQRETFFSKLFSKPISALTKEDKEHLQAVSEGKSAQDEAISKFIKVFDRLATILEAAK